MLVILFVVVGICLLVCGIRGGNYNTKVGYEYTNDNYKTYTVYSYSERNIVCVVFASILLIGSMSIWMAIYSSQIGRCIKRDVCTKQIALATERCESLLPIIKIELDKYPEHEAKVFEEYTGKGMFINIPPDVKASKTILTAVDKIEKINDKTYNLRFEYEKITGSINYINRWIWMITPGIPKK